MPNQFYLITSAAPEDEHLTRERALVELALHQAAEADKSSAHICYARYEPDLRVGRNHPRSPSRTERMSVASMAPSRLTSARPGISMFIVRCGAKDVFCSGFAADGSSSVTETG